jgi:Fe-S cluster assembly protein SufD
LKKKVTTGLKPKWFKIMELDTNIIQPIAGIFTPDFEAPSNPIAQAAKLDLQQLNLPTTRDEAWKYTRLTKLKAHNFSVNKQEALDAEVTVPEIYSNIPRVVLVNGFFRSDLSNLPNSQAIEFSTEIENSEAKPFSNLNDFFRKANYAYANQIINLKFTAKNSLNQPIALVNLLTGKERLVQPRVNIVAEKFSENKMILATHATEDNFNLVNSIFNIRVEPEAKLQIDKIQEAYQSFLFEHEAINQADNSNFGINTFCLKGAIIRNDLHVYVNGVNCESQLYGIFLPAQKELMDNHTLVDHLKPHCMSDENYRGVMMGEGTGVFNGKVFVRQDSQKINAFQQNKNVLLSKTAQIYAKPELEIYADDVKCSHGSTTGKLDEQALFYLQARGIGRSKANILLVKAFINEVIANVYNEFLLNYLEQALEDKLNS